jgi:hypothetical protein
MINVGHSNTGAELELFTNKYIRVSPLLRCISLRHRLTNVQVNLRLIIVCLGLQSLGLAQKDS